MSGRLVIALVAAVALSGAVAAGCGSSEGDDRSEDRAAIEALVADLNAANETRDAAGLCTVFSRSSVEGVFGSRARCQKETAAVLDNIDKPERVVIADIAFVDDTARVTFEGRAGDANLVLEDGRWYFSLDQQVDPGAGSDGAADGP